VERGRNRRRSRPAFPAFDRPARIGRQHADAGADAPPPADAAHEFAEAFDVGSAGRVARICEVDDVGPGGNGDLGLFGAGDGGEHQGHRGRSFGIAGDITHLASCAAND
jgi:hypothetical protein